MEPNTTNTAKHASRRSHTNLSDLRLAPLARDTSLDDAPISFQSHHSSYIQGKSAPSTPGILGRGSSRRQHQGAGLSRRLSIYDQQQQQQQQQENPFDYAAIQVTDDGVPRNALRPEPGSRQPMPKAKSEAALLARRRHVYPKPNTPQISVHSPNLKRISLPPQDNWITRAGLATTSLLRESKGQSWLDSSTSLQRDGSDDDDDDEDALASMSASAMSHQRLHFADDELSPETPRARSIWGSRFGSRPPSQRTSRRGSRVDLNLSSLDYLDRAFADRDMDVRPDFVDPMDMSDDEDPEREVARLAREASFGFGSIVDRLVGWSLFNVEEDREATDVEDENDGPSTRHVSTPRNITETRVPAQAAGRPPATEPPRPDAQDEGGWQDAAWLLGIASKVLF